MLISSRHTIERAAKDDRTTCTTMDTLGHRFLWPITNGRVSVGCPGHIFKISGS